jgi:hypothetical protein
MSPDMIQISEELFEKVSQALNAAIPLALMHAPLLHPKIMEAAFALDDAANGPSPDPIDEGADDVYRGDPD